MEQVKSDTTETEPNNIDSKPNSNDVQRTTRKNQGKQIHNNDSKKSRKIKNKVQANQDDASAQIFQQMQEKIRERLLNCESGKELEVLHNTLKPDAHTLWLHCMDVKKDLLMAFQRYYPLARLEVFGSTVMGIAFKDSDFDFFIELTREPLTTKPAAIIGKAMNILRQSGHFTNFLPISHARVPILKCYHIRTGYQCDINFSDCYGILNSPIVARLLTYDSRIFVLATILKFWSKLHDCAGKNRISNYAIIWMLLFYMQQLNIPILPPISEFQKRIQAFVVNGYNFAFDDRLPNNTRNQMRCSELLLGFFKFYKDFDFATNVICPLFGKAFRKTDIETGALPEFHRYIELLNLNQQLTPLQMNKSICIQDPFEITHSIPGVISNLEFEKIICKFGHAAELIEAELQSDGESTKLLLLLFDEEEFNQNAQARMVNHSKESRMKNQTAVHSSCATYKSTLRIKPTDYHLSIVREILPKMKINSKIDNKAIYRTWNEFIVESIVLILRDIFMLQIEIVDDTEFNKEFNISGSRDVFLGRKQTKKITSKSLSAEMLESQERFKNNTFDIHLKANIKITSDIDNFDEVIIEIQDSIKTKKNNSFKSFYRHFDQNLNNLLKIYLVFKLGSK